MKKVGIVSLYYKNHNYGGLLQSYALCKLIRNYGYDAEQISVKHYTAASDGSKFKKFLHSSGVQKKKMIKSAFVRISLKIDSAIKKKNNAAISVDIQKRNKTLESFEKLVPHSECVYDHQNINSAIGEYGCFVTGSDQVWNPDWYLPEYFLEFVPKGVPKFSYAASIAQNFLTDEQKSMFRRSLMDYMAVSVRESNAVSLISNLSPVPVEFVLDPTLVLPEKDWYDVCSDRIVNGKYILCFFLGNDTDGHKSAKLFAKSKGIKLVNLPHLNGKYRKSDNGFADIDLYDVPPADFLSLIRYTEYIFTNSFHATVFSSVFHKNYFVFNRRGSKGMGSRIYSLTSILGTENRFCNTKERMTADYMLTLADIDYSVARPDFDKMKADSTEFLKSNLQKAEAFANVK